MSITGAIRCLNPTAYSNYKYEIIHDPIFTDYGEPDMPQGETSPVCRHHQLHDGRRRDDLDQRRVAGQGLAQPGDGPLLRHAAADGYITTLRFMAPWSDNLKEIRLGYLPYNQPDQPITAIKTLTASAHAPAVSWTSKPSSGASLSGSVTLKFTARDADGDKLYAWLKYSTDGGTTYQPPPTGSRDCIGRQPDDVQLRRLPDRHRVPLQTAGQRRHPHHGRRGGQLLGGRLFAPWARPRSGPRRIAVGTNPGLPLTITLPVRNTGRGELIVGLDPASAPSWMNDGDKTRQWSIEPGVEEVLTWRTSALEVGTHKATFKLTTNNPATPTIDFPVTLVIVATTQPTLDRRE
jgi:hypothetical protein